MRLAVDDAAIRRGCVWPIRPLLAAPEFQADFRQLGGLAGAGFAADDDDLMRAQRLGDFGAAADTGSSSGKGSAAADCARSLPARLAAGHGRAGWIFLVVRVQT